MPSLSLYMNQSYVGELIQQPNGAHQLSYDPSWLQDKKSRPLSLSLPLQKGKISSEKVFNFFDNLLPDSPLIRQRIMQRFTARSNRPFDLLSHIGRDSVGAITLLAEPLPPIAIAEKPELQFEPLTDTRLQVLLLGYQSEKPLGMLDDADDFRISVAGAQEKTALLHYQGQWCIPKGMTATTHILKLPIGEIKGPTATLDLSDSVENEWLCIELARECGFEVPAVEIVKLDDVKALAVTRFDRRWTTAQNWLIRLPQEDMCQAHGISPALKYEKDGGPGISDIMKLLMGSSNALADRDSFMRFQVFQWLIGATDGHAKNFSIYLEAGGTYRLTPFYDILSAYPLLGGKGLDIRKLSLAMGLTASKGKKYKLDLIQPRHFINTAKATGFDAERMQQIMDDFAKTMPSAIARLQQRMHALIPQVIQTAIFGNTLQQLKRLQD